MRRISRTDAETRQVARVSEVLQNLIIQEVTPLNSRQDRDVLDGDGVRREQPRRSGQKRRAQDVLRVGKGVMEGVVDVAFEEVNGIVDELARPPGEDPRC
jgi:hypothetical protein